MRGKFALIAILEMYFADPDSGKHYCNGPLIPLSDGIDVTYHDISAYQAEISTCE